MGVLSDAIRARLDEMRARHDQEMIEINQAREEAEAALNRLIKSTDQLLYDLDHDVVSCVDH